MVNINGTIVVSTIDQIRENISPNMHSTMCMTIEDFNTLAFELLTEFGKFTAAILVKSSMSKKSILQNDIFKLGESYVELTFNSGYEINSIKCMQMKIQLKYSDQ